MEDKTVEDLMETELTTVTPDGTLPEVRRMLWQGGLHHVPVVERGRLVGMLTSNDLLRVTRDAYAADEQTVDSELDARTIREVMQEDIVTIGPTQPLRRAAELLATGAYHGLPVVKDGQLVGLLTTTDLVRHMLERM